MKKLLLIFLLLLTPGFALAALAGGSWTANDGLNIQIINGQSAEFEYRIQAVSNYQGVQGKYSIWLYENNNPITTYFFDEPTINNQASGFVTINPSDYNNAAGTYQLRIYASDYFGADTHVLSLDVTSLPQMTVSCDANPRSGQAPLTTSFSAAATGGSGTFSTYQWNFNDGSQQTTNAGSTSHKYNNAGTYNPIVTITDSLGNSATAQCPQVTVTAPPATLTVSCSATPTSGTAPLNVNFAAQVSGGSGSYTNYAWFWNDGASENTNMNTAQHTYSSAGTYTPVLTVRDSNNNIASTECPVIYVNAQPPKLNVTYINCFDTVIKGQNQSCQVYVKDLNGHAVGNANVNVYYLDDGLFGSCISDSISGGCTVYREQHIIGRFTVYATATKTGYIEDTDTYPRKTYEVWDHRYDIINLDTYNESSFVNRDKDFYRGEALYVKFQIYDTINHVFITRDVVTQASLVSAPGGRADMTKMNFDDDWYYYRIDQIPLTHDFLGQSNVFAFAFNLSEQTGGQAQTDLTIYNNVPFISPLPTTNMLVGQTQTLDLYEYGYDLEDARNLLWVVASTESGVFAQVSYTNNRPILSVTAEAIGLSSVMLRAYDLDDDYAQRSLLVNVNATPQNLAVSCSANPTTGNVPLDVNFNSEVTGGSGPYTYRWDFHDGTTQNTDSTDVAHRYLNAGTYNPTLEVRDSHNDVASASCPQITVTQPVQPILTVDRIVCNPAIPINTDQTCTVYVKADGVPATNAQVDVYFVDGTYFGSCTTSNTDGACGVTRLMSQTGTYTVYATAVKTGHISDTDTYPRASFVVYDRRYEVRTLNTYNDSAYMNEDHVFYRGEPLYVKFQVYDLINNEFVDADIVDSMILASSPGGVIELTRDNFASTFYYYRLNQIPLTHGFLGSDNDFIFEFNDPLPFADRTDAGITILNNAPFINPIAAVNMRTGETRTIRLCDYGYDLEDQANLQWSISSTSGSGFTAQLLPGTCSLLSIEGVSQGTGTITLRAFDLDAAFAERTVQVSVTPSGIIYDFTCSAIPTSGTTPLTTQFSITNNAPSGTAFGYRWSFGDSNIQDANETTLSHTYTSAGTYNPSVLVSDAFGNSKTVACPTITVQNNIPQLSCNANPTSGTSPLIVTFNANVEINGEIEPGTQFVEFQWVFDDSSSITTPATTTSLNHPYLSARQYNPSIIGVRANGQSMTAQCPQINVAQGNYTLLADPNGPYRGFVNEAITFDATGSQGNIIIYEWDFGDGTVAQTTSPLLSHAYNMIGVYTVKLTVTDVYGLKDNATTTATIIEATNFTQPRERIQQGLWIGRIQMTGKDGVEEIARSDDELSISLDLSNDFEYDIDDARIIIEIADLGIKQKSQSFDLRNGQDKHQSIIVDLYDAPPGWYQVKIIVQDDNVRRVKYRDLLIKDRIGTSGCGLPSVTCRL